MASEVASWIPAAVASTLSANHRAQPVIKWLEFIRDSIEEYDPLIAVTPTEDSDTSSTTPDSAFDEILSQLGKEIFKLDQYQRNLTSDEKEVSLSILNIFDECLEDIKEADVNEHFDVSKDIVRAENGFVNGCADDCSDVESTLSDASFVTSTPGKGVKATAGDINSIFDKGNGTPVAPRRARLKTPSSSYMDMEIKTNGGMRMSKRLVSESDSESTCWSYKECSSDTEDMRDGYAGIWSQSSGYHNSDAIIRRVISQHYATVSRLSFDTTGDLSPAQYSVYALHEVGARDRHRCVDIPMPVESMTPEKPNDDCYESVLDAVQTDENIYEEIDYGYNYTDEGFSCGGSVEVESVSMSASSEGVGSESPLYANLRDHDAYAISADVIYWKNLLLDPYNNDDEEDEWITPDECSVYSHDSNQRPPFVIPRISQCRGPRPRAPSQLNHYPQDLPDTWGPSCERLQARSKDRGGYTKLGNDSPPFGGRLTLDKRLGSSTENLLTPRRPYNLQLPPSSSGDSLDVEVRDHIEYGRNRKSRSMVATKPKKSPVPAPRQLPHSSIEASVVFEGFVKRTKYTENGKKSKKNWTDCYMVLTQTALVFYKDHKTYQATKVPRVAGTPPSPTAPRADLVLPLQNAHLVPCIPTYTRRFTKSLILTVGHDQYLLQDETEERIRIWLGVIQSVIFKLGPPLIPEQHNNLQQMMHYQSSNTDLESLGRTPPALRHLNRNKQKAGGSSNEDLSDSTEKSHVRNKLKKLLNKRPSKDQLYKKGIMRDEPVFGRNLEEVCPANSPRVPAFVVACIKEIESSEENMCTDGLYRASGNLSQVQKIRLQVDQNNLKVLEENIDIHVLTGSLKLFFRELKEPLIPCNMFDKVLAACSIKPKEAKIEKFRDIVNALPQCNRETLKFLLEHLLNVTQYSERNRMHTANLAIVFGPTLLWAPAEQAHNIAIDCIQQNNVVDILLNEFHSIFGETKKKA